MAATLEDTTVTYEDLAAIERDFEDAELEIIRTQTRLLTPLYAARDKTTSQIPNFWPLVLEQAPPDIDQYIQPSDSALLLSSILSLSVTHFEPEVDPRSIAVTLTFKPNDTFTDTELTKKFYFRRDGKGFAGLVSEPVRISWKSKEADLTGGLLDLVCDAWEEEKKQTKGASANGNGKEKTKPALTPAQKALKKKIANTGMGGLSFFAWFGYIGRRISAEESVAASEKLAAERESQKKGEKSDADAESKEDEEEDDDISYELEIFPDGDDLAIAISEDLWPGAIKYFTQAQEDGDLSDASFESGDDEGEMSDLNEVLGAEDDDGNDEEEAAAALPARKKRKT